MLPSKHFILGLLFAGFLYFIFPKINFIGFLIIIFSAFLIDVDHYLYYVYKKKNFSLRKAYKWFIENKKKLLSLPWEQRNKFQTGFSFLHGIEILLILLILWVFVSKYFLFVFVGFAFHLLLDSIDQTTYWDRISKVSLVRDYLKYRN